MTLYALFGVSQDSLRFTAKGNTTGWADQGKHKTMRYTHRATMQNLVPGQVYCESSFFQSFESNSPIAIFESINQMIETVNIV